MSDIFRIPKFFAILECVELILFVFNSLISVFSGIVLSLITVQEMEEFRNIKTNAPKKKEPPPETVLLHELKGANLNQDFPLQLFLN